MHVPIIVHVGIEKKVFNEHLFFINETYMIKKRPGSSSLPGQLLSIQYQSKTRFGVSLADINLSRNRNVLNNLLLRKGDGKNTVLHLSRDLLKVNVLCQVEALAE